MRSARRLLPALVLAAASFQAGAQADATADLVELINDYRTSLPSCEGQRATMASPLSPSDRLASVAPAGPRELGAALRASGYPAAAATTIQVSGAEDAAVAFRLVVGRYCLELLDPRYSQIGVARSAGNAWRINLARPLLPASLGDWRRAGRRILALVNEARARPRQCGAQRFAPAPPLAWNEALGAAALVHSRDMAEGDYFSHDDAEGRTVGRRAAAAGYRWQIVGENIAAGTGDPADVVAGWLASPGHCANIMTPEFAEMGAAYAVRNGSVRGVWWTQTFGRS